MADVKDRVAETGHKIADGTENATDWVQEMTGIGESCGPSRDVADVRHHMAVFSSCGCKVGTVDHIEGGVLKLTRRDSTDGLHHYLPMAWVDHVDEHVHLNKTADETRMAWESDFASAR
jgi:hypothetical protein